MKGDVVHSLFSKESTLYFNLARFKRNCFSFAQMGSVLDFRY